MKESQSQQMINSLKSKPTGIIGNQKSPEEKEKAEAEALLAQGGLLSLEIVEGQLIKDTELWGEMDPFVVVDYQEVKYKTTTAKDGGRKPKWGETLEIPI